jgi:hypothetical protein
MKGRIAMWKAGRTQRSPELSCRGALASSIVRSRGMIPW